MWAFEFSTLGNPDFNRAVDILLKGGVAIYPTETFYALGGDPGNDSTVERIFSLKGRDFSKPLPLIASDRTSMLPMVSMWPEIADRLADVFWPGPLSLLLPAAAWVSPKLHAGSGKLAMRISPHPAAAGLAEALGGMIISTSANLSGEPACRILKEIPGELMNGVDVAISGGIVVGGSPSTIVDLTVSPPRLVREGAVAWGVIRQVLGS
jgi:L-threonylcarbamoyladenylate synthase